jgi:hypothetical protein
MSFGAGAPYGYDVIAPEEREARAELGSDQPDRDSAGQAESLFGCRRVGVNSLTALFASKRCLRRIRIITVDAILLKVYKSIQVYENRAVIPSSVASVHPIRSVCKSESVALSHPDIGQ